MPIDIPRVQRSRTSHRPRAVIAVASAVAASTLGACASLALAAEPGSGGAAYSIDTAQRSHTARELARPARPARASAVKVPAILNRIAECESGGNPRAVSRNGLYRGKYQFHRATWRSLGGKGDPARASEREQDRRAIKLYRAAGTSPWPVCGRA